MEKLVLTQGAAIIMLAIANILCSINMWRLKKRVDNLTQAISYMIQDIFTHN